MTTQPLSEVNSLLRISAPLIVSLILASRFESVSIARWTVMPPCSCTPFTIESISYCAFTIAASRESDLRCVSLGRFGSEAPMPIDSR